MFSKLQPVRDYSLFTKLVPFVVYKVHYIHFYNSLPLGNNIKYQCTDVTIAGNKEQRSRQYTKSSQITKVIWETIQVTPNNKSIQNLATYHSGIIHIGRQNNRMWQRRFLNAKPYVHLKVLTHFIIYLISQTIRSLGRKRKRTSEISREVQPLVRLEECKLEGHGGGRAAVEVSLHHRQRHVLNQHLGSTRVIDLDKRAGREVHQAEEEKSDIYRPSTLNARFSKFHEDRRSTI